MKRLSECNNNLPPRFDDLKRLVAYIINTYGLWWVLEAMIANIQEGNTNKPYENILLDNLNKTLDDYQARYDDEKE